MGQKEELISIKSTRLSTIALRHLGCSPTARHVLADDYNARSTIDIWLKDLGLVMEMAQFLKLPVLLSATALQMFQMASSAGYGKQDDAAIVKIYEDLLDFKVLDSIRPHPE